MSVSPHGRGLNDTVVELSPGPRYNTPTTVFYGLAALSLSAVVAAVGFQRPQLLAVAGPSLVMLIVGLLDGRYPTVTVTADLDTPRALEGDLTRLGVTVASDERVEIVEIEMESSEQLEAVGPHRYVLTVEAGTPRTVTFALVPVTWGVLDLPALTVRARHRSGLFATAVRYRCSTPLRVHIHEEPTRSQLEPAAFRRVVGSHLSADRGEGCEIADIRPYHPGDPLRSMNWRISARSDRPWITLRHPDRSTTVILVLDAFGGYGDGHRDTLRRTVRAAIGVARLHLRAQDPVGLLLLGPGRRWIEPQLGLEHLSRLTDALLELSTDDWGDRQLRRVPLPLLVPVDAVVIAISPLLSGSIGSALAPLLARDQPVHIVEPVYRLPDVITLSSRDDNGDPSIAWRVFTVEQQLRRRALAGLGASISPWAEDEPVEMALVKLRGAQRRLPSVSRHQPGPATAGRPS